MKNVKFKQVINLIIAILTAIASSVVVSSCITNGRLA